MATTNPHGPGESPTPGAGPQWPRDVEQGHRGDDHAGGGGVNPESVRAGHEPDAFDLKPILSVPAAVAATFVLAFVTATAVFAYLIYGRSEERPTYPAAAARNEAPLDQQLNRLSRKGLAPGVHPEVDKPRPEPNQILDHNGRAITRVPTGGPEVGNPPLLHPEDIRPDNVPLLNEKGPHRIPISEAIERAAGADRARLLPTAKGAQPIIGRAINADRASHSNAGRAPLPPGVAELGGPEPKKEGGKEPGKEGKEPAKGTKEPAKEPAKGTKEPAKEPAKGETPKAPMPKEATPPKKEATPPPPQPPKKEATPPPPPPPQPPKKP